jgi:hypothetical protein
MGDIAKTKGVGFANVKAFVEDRFGPEGWPKVTERLSPEDRDELTSVLSVGWYPVDLYARLIHALDEVHGYGDLSLIVQLGRYEAERDLTTIHRFFLKFTNPAFIVEKTADYWKRFHDTGQWKVVREGDMVIGTLENWGIVDAAMCRELVGYLGRVLELVGAKNVLMEHPRCRGRGDPACYFQGRWGERRSIVGVPSSSPDVHPPLVPTPRGHSGAVPLVATKASKGGKADSG